MARIDDLLALAFVRKSMSQHGKQEPETVTAFWGLSFPTCDIGQ